jgi:hypothetical protein
MGVLCELSHDQIPNLGKLRNSQQGGGGIVGEGAGGYSNNQVHGARVDLGYNPEAHCAHGSRRQKDLEEIDSKPARTHSADPPMQNPEQNHSIENRHG